MLVDDKLAKEKLNKVILGYLGHIDWDLVELIRNTDLTDCQRQDSESHGVKYGHAESVIAPAPDQGSVRNATDMRERCAKACEDLANLRDANGPSFRGDGMREAAAAIRALPDQKD